MKSLTIGDSLFLVVAGAGLAAATLLFFRDPAFAARSGEGRQVGTLTFRVRDAERRQSGSGLWTGISDGQPVYDGDTIRTGSLSSASISLGGESAIVLDEQSMVVIRVADNRAELSLQGGSATVSAGKAEPGALAMTLNAGNGAVGIESGAVRAKLDGSTATLSADGGDAQVVAAGGKAVELNAATRLNPETGDAREAQTYVSEPADGASFTAEGETARIRFAWTDPNATLSLASPGSSPILLSAASETAGAGTAEAWADLSPGRWAWRLADTGETGVLTVVPDPTPLNLSPSGASIQGTALAVPVSFRWASPVNGGRFRFDLYRAADPGRALISKTVVTRAITVDVPGAGDYRWTVTALATGTQRTAEASFSVTAEPPAPPVFTAVKPVATVESLDAGTPLARWKADSGATGYEVRVSSDAEGKVASRVTRVTSNVYVPDPVPETGTWYLSVRSLSGAARSDWSEPTAVAVREASVPVATESAGGALPVTDEALTLSWSDEIPSSRYRVQISTSPDFSAPVAETVVRTSPARIDVPEGLSGEIWWRVQGLDAAGDPIATSKPVSASLPRVLSPAEPLRPADGTRFELNKTDSIRFSWKAVEGDVRYRLTLARVVGGLSVPVGSWDTENTSLALNDLSALALDSFSWTVETLPSGNDADGTTPRPALSDRLYFSIYQKSALPVPKIRRMETKGAL